MKIVNIFWLGLSVIVLAVSACGDDDDSPTIRTFQNVRDDFSAIDITEGIHDETLVFLNGVFWDFRVIIPAVVSGQEYPLVIDLHGASGGATDAHQHTDCYVEPAFEDMEAFILSPNGGSDLWTSFRNQEMVINLLLLAREYWPIDIDKVVVTGYSNGGNGSWFFGETQADLFSAAIPMASSYTTISTDGSVRTMPVPMYVIHGENDELFPVEETQNWVSQTVNEGSDVTLVVAPGLGHYEPCSYVDYLRDATEWLVNDVW